MGNLSDSEIDLYRPESPAVARVLYLLSIAEPSLVRHAVLNHLAFWRTHPLPYSDLVAEIRARNLGCHQRDVELSVARAIGLSAPSLVALDKETRSFGVSFAYHDLITAVYIRGAVPKATYNRLISGFEVFAPAYASAPPPMRQGVQQVIHISTSSRPSPNAKCAEPNVDAKTTNAVAAEMPQTAKQQGLSGVVDVAVSLDAMGTIIDAKVYKSSGSDDFDAAALAAAKASTYTAEVVNCVPRGGTYIYRADFTSE